MHCAPVENVSMRPNGQIPDTRRQDILFWDQDETRDTEVWDRNAVEMLITLRWDRDQDRDRDRDYAQPCRPPPNEAEMYSVPAKITQGLGQLSLPSLRGRQIEYQPLWLGLRGARSLVLGGR